MMCGLEVPGESHPSPTAMHLDVVMPSLTNVRHWGQEHTFPLYANYVLLTPDPSFWCQNSDSKFELKISDNEKINKINKKN